MSAFAAPTGAGFQGGGVPTRPLTQGESEQLRRLLRGPGLTVARTLGLLGGLAGLMLSVTYFAGVPYDPDIFLLMAPTAGFWGMVMGGAASAASRGPRDAMKRGEVVDLTAPVAEGSSAPRGLRAFRVGPWALLMPSRTARQLQPGPSQRVAVATGLHDGRFPGYGRVGRGLLLSVNGVALPKPRPVYFEPGSVQPSAAFPGAGAAAPMMLKVAAAAAPGTPAASGVLCGKCGATSPALSRFCGQCASPLPPYAK